MSFQIVYETPFAKKLTSPVYHVQGVAFPHYSQGLFLRNLLNRDWVSRKKVLEAALKNIEGAKDALPSVGLETYVTQRRLKLALSTKDEAYEILSWEGVWLPYEQFSKKVSFEYTYAYILYLHEILAQCPKHSTSNSFRRDLRNQCEEYIIHAWVNLKNEVMPYRVGQDWWMAHIEDERGNNVATVLMPDYEGPKSADFLKYLNEGYDPITNEASKRSLRALGILPPDPLLSHPNNREIEKRILDTLNNYKCKSAPQVDPMVEIRKSTIMEILRAQ